MQKQKPPTIRLKSLCIVRPEYNCTQFRKHQLVFLLDDELTNAQRKWIHKMKARYETAIVENWKDLGLNGRRDGRTEKMLVVRERYQKEILRELILNPGLKVIIWSKNANLERLKDTKINFASTLTSQLQNYLHNNKEQLIINK